MSYDHASAVAYVGQLVAERHPAYYDLCRRHVDALTVPKGWKIRREPLGVAGSDSADWHQSPAVASRNAI